MADPKSFFSDVTPQDFFADVANSPKVTSVPSVADQARERLAKNLHTTPEKVKANPPSPTEFSFNPFADYGLKTKLHPAPTTFGKSWMDNLNPINMLDASLDAATNFMPMGSAPGMNQRQPEQLTPGNFSRDMGALGSPHAPVQIMNDMAHESYARGERGQSTEDLYGAPAAMATTYGVLKLPRAILPADIAAETATRAQRSALGTEAEHFQSGATPDVATLQDPAGSVYRSQGRQLKGIQADKTLERTTLKQELNTPKYNALVSDPMQAVQPVIDDAMSRAGGNQRSPITGQMQYGPEGTRIQDFQNLLGSKISSLSNGTMKLTPAQLVDLKQWVDGFISTYKEEPIGTMRDLAQNTYKALRKHLETVAPETEVRNQRIHSLIEAENALRDKMYTPTPEAKTTIGAVKNMFMPLIPETLVKTATAAAFRGLSGGLLDRPPIPTAPGMPPQAAPTAQAAGATPTAPAPNAPPNAPTAPPGPNVPPAGASPLPAPQTPPAASGAVESVPNLVESAPPPAPTIPQQPTHVNVGEQVTGFDPQGNLVSGPLQKLYAVIENDQPTWKGLVLDPKKGKTVEVPADQLYNRLSGPPNTKKAAGVVDLPGSKTSYKELGNSNPTLPRGTHRVVDKPGGTEPASVFGGGPPEDWPKPKGISYQQMDDPTDGLVR